MKTTRLLFVLSVFSLCSLSCSTDSDDPTDILGKVHLKALLPDTGATRIGDSWDGTEHIGVYMTESDSFIGVDEVANRKFSVTAGSGSMLQPVEGEMPSYPDDGRNVNFTAYYPYTSAVSNNIYPINLADNTVSDHDLLYAATTESYNRLQTNAVPLMFSHQLSKLILKLKIEKNNGAGETTVIDPEADWSAAITRSTKAGFDLATGQLRDISVSKALPMVQNETAVESIILPGQEGKVIITYDGRPYEWKTGGNKFEAGVQYTYTITLKTPATETPEPVNVKLESTIKDWNKVSGEIELEETESDSDLPDDESVYISNLDFSNFELGTSTYHSFVSISEKEYAAIKMGSGTKIGSCKSGIVGASKKQLSFYAIAWTGAKGTLKISVNNGGKIDGKSSVTINPIGNAGATGGGSTGAVYTIAVADTDYYQYSLSDLTENSTLSFETLSGTNDPRSIIFGVNVK